MKTKFFQNFLRDGFEKNLKNYHSKFRFVVRNLRIIFYALNVFRLIIHQRKFDKGMHTLSFYNTRKFTWINEQLKNLPEEMSEEDREKFFCDYKSVREIIGLKSSNESQNFFYISTKFSFYCG